LCKKSFAAYGGRIFFWETRHFHDFAKRNRENDVSPKTSFGRRKRRKTFYTTPNSRVTGFNYSNMSLNKNGLQLILNNQSSKLALAKQIQ
jgi:hypothetical protein